MARYGEGLIGIDVKPHRRGTRFRRNHFKTTHSPWLFPAIVVLVSMGIIVVGMR